jgi:NADP-dependent 3-hydroxy acid dehydrogenase YdfG
LLERLSGGVSAAQLAVSVIRVCQEKKRVGTPSIVDKVVVITGASSGIGESTARLLAGNGAKVVLGARRTDRIDALVKDITAKGGSALASQTDVAKRGEVEALVQGAIAKHGRIDVIVNNAGIMPIAPMAALKVEEWDRMIDVNIKGLLYGVAAVLPIMQKQKQGHIINISSVGGFKVFAPGGTVYSATKFAVRAITEGLRMEHKADNIRCTIISPGAIATELPESSSGEGTRESLREFYKMAIPADSIARAIAYAIEQPAEVDVNEIVIRPAKQDF